MKIKGFQYNRPDKVQPFIDIKPFSEELKLNANSPH